MYTPTKRSGPILFLQHQIEPHLPPQPDWTFFRPTCTSSREHTLLLCLPSLFACLAPTPPSLKVLLSLSEALPDQPLSTESYPTLQISEVGSLSELQFHICMTIRSMAILLLLFSIKKLFLNQFQEHRKIEQKVERVPTYPVPTQLPFPPLSAQPT